jgi:hypothetical protein
MLGAHNILNQILVFHIDGEDLAHFVDADHAVGACVADGHEYELVRDALAVNQGCARCFVHEEVAHLGDDEEKPVAISVLILNLFWFGAGLPISMMWRRCTDSFAFFSQKEKREFL